jgi:hypothetical protein
MGDRNARHQEVDTHIKDLQDRVGQVEWACGANKRAFEQLGRPYRLVVEGCNRLEQVYERELQAEGGGWRKIKELAAEALVKDIEEHLAEALAGRGGEGSKGQEIVRSAMDELGKTLTTSCVENVYVVSKKGNDGNATRVKGSFNVRLSHKHQLRAVTIQQLLEDVLSDEMRIASGLAPWGKKAENAPPPDGQRKRLLIYNEPTAADKDRAAKGRGKGRGKNADGAGNAKGKGRGKGKKGRGKAK